MYKFDIYLSIYIYILAMRNSLLGERQVFLFAEWAHGVCRHVPEIIYIN